MLIYLGIAKKFQTKFLLGSLQNVLSSGVTFSYVSLLFVRVLSRSRACRPKCGLLHNSLMDSDKMVKLVLLALYSCLVSIKILLDFFS